MILIARIFLVAGFCVGTLGAAGFDKQRESGAWPIFAAGLVLLFSGGFLFRRTRAGAGASQTTAQGEKDRYQRQLIGVRDAVRQLSAQARELDPDEIRHTIDDLSLGALFDLTSEHEQISALLGFRDYARVWEGVAAGERLLNRAWSMLTDGAIQEGLAEIPLALAQFEAAVEAFPGQ